MTRYAPVGSETDSGLCELITRHAQGNTLNVKTDTKVVFTIAEYRQVNFMYCRRLPMK